MSTVSWRENNGSLSNWADNLQKCVNTLSSLFSSSVKSYLKNNIFMVYIIKKVNILFICSTYWYLCTSILKYAFLEWGLNPYSASLA